MSNQILEDYLTETISVFGNYKKLAEKALVQVTDDEFFKQIDEESNSIAQIVKHISGNLLSRWTNFLNTDGEKPTRNRDSEFITENDSRESLMDFWENGWKTLFNSLESLQSDDLAKIVKIRSEDFTVVKAINRSITHITYHIGQIAFLAKHLRANDWQTLSIPKNKSAEFNTYLSAKEDKGNYLEATQEFTKGLKKED